MQELKVKLPVFEGPLDLLLHLVKVNEMEIQDIRIAEITQQYLNYLRLMETLDLEIAGEFLVMASTLINIKLRALLPAVDEDEDEDEEIGDIMTARALMERLIEYRKFKEAASALRDKEQKQADVFFRDVALPKLAAHQDNEALDTDMDRLLQAFSRVLRFVDAAGWHLVTEEEFTVEEKIDLLDQMLAEKERIDVEEVFRQSRSKLELIVYLLAVLELCQLRRARLEQIESFGKIYLFRIETPAPTRKAEIEGANSGEGAPAAQIVELVAEDKHPSREPR